MGWMGGGGGPGGGWRGDGMGGGTGGGWRGGGLLAASDSDIGKAFDWGLTRRLFGYLAPYNIRKIERHLEGFCETHDQLRRTDPR
jgi:hypothetical protein